MLPKLKQTDYKLPYPEYVQWTSNNHKYTYVSKNLIKNAKYILYCTKELSVLFKFSSSKHKLAHVFFLWKWRFFFLLSVYCNELLHTLLLLTNPFSNIITRTIQQLLLLAFKAIGVVAHWTQ